MKGFSSRNLNYMRKFAQECNDPEFVQQIAAQLPWFHIATIMDRIETKEDQIFYMKSAIEYGWSRSVMVMQIETSLHKRQGSAIINFKIKLASPQFDLAHYTLKDPYIFDFLSIGKEAHEREVEKRLIQHMEKFLLELGAGFSFVGRQYHLEVGNHDFYIDLLFYHLRIRCFVVIELKDKDFKPEYAGKQNIIIHMRNSLLFNFYLILRRILSAHNKDISLSNLYKKIFDLPSNISKNDINQYLEKKCLPNTIDKWNELKYYINKNITHSDSDKKT